MARLTVGDATVGELAAPYDISLQAISKHLRVLEDAGLVSRSREAQRRSVHLQAEVFDLMAKWIERYRRQAEERYKRLDAVLAELDETTPCGDERYGFHGSFHEVSPDRITQTFTYEGEPDGASLGTLTFEYFGNGVTRLHAQSLVDSFEDRDAWLRSGMEVGVNDGCAKLDDLLANNQI